MSQTTRRLTSLAVTLWVVAAATLTLTPAPGSQSRVRAQAAERGLELLFFPAEALKVVEVRNLNSENFPVALEVVVKNASDKPIYHIGLAGVFSGSAFGTGFSYGARRLSDVQEIAAAEDKPIKPGETVILRQQRGVIEGYRAALREQSALASAISNSKRLVLVFQTLNFGDGTGYILDTPFPVREARRSN
jgi:hypothetical protein